VCGTADHVDRDIPAHHGGDLHRLSPSREGLLTMEAFFIAMLAAAIVGGLVGLWL
jgi:hypothetical protein